MDLDAAGQKLRTVEVRQYVGDAVRTLYTDPDDLRRKWSDFDKRSEVVEQMAERGIAFHELAELAGTPDADVFDLLCHVAFNAPLRTRRERADRLKKDKADFFDQYGPEARVILAALLEKYAVHGTSQLNMPDALEVPPISDFGNVIEIAKRFGGTDKLLAAVGKMHELLYAA
jgi:type I restriction enzyme R subunit